MRNNRMPDYSKGKIYTIRCRTDDSLIYVGSTIQPLSTRFGGHKRNTRISLHTYINNPENNTSWDEWYIELYENCPCDTKEELFKRENEVIRLIGSINKRNAYSNNKEHYQQNKDKISAKQKKYYEQNKDKINVKRIEYNKEYHQRNRDVILAKYKEYYTQNKDVVLAKNREYYEQNKDKILAKQKEHYEQKEKKII